tara:strand:+ start:759 stop:1034 length:276 start_codon:yes stop_codon:yes gene_type:complete
MLHFKVIAGGVATQHGMVGDCNLFFSEKDYCDDPGAETCSSSLPSSSIDYSIAEIEVMVAEVRFFQFHNFCDSDICRNLIHQNSEPQFCNF